MNNYPRPGYPSDTLLFSSIGYEADENNYQVWAVDAKESDGSIRNCIVLYNRYFCDENWMIANVPFTEELGKEFFEHTIKHSLNVTEVLNFILGWKARWNARPFSSESTPTPEEAMSIHRVNADGSIAEVSATAIQSKLPETHKQYSQFNGFPTSREIQASEKVALARKVTGRTFTALGSSVQVKEDAPEVKPVSVSETKVKVHVSNIVEKVMALEAEDFKKVIERAMEQPAVASTLLSEMVKLKIEKEKEPAPVKVEAKPRSFMKSFFDGK